MLTGIAQLNFRPVTHQTFRVALGCALLVSLFRATAFGDEPQKNVLIFNSEDLNRPGSMLVNPAIRSTLKDHWKSSIQTYDEALDSFRLPSQNYEAELVKLLQRKYEAVNLDLIFALGTPALRFLLKHRGDLFTDTPIVFLIQDQSRIADLNLGTNVTGVLGKIEVAPTLDLALAFHPQTQRVVVVAGNAPFDQGLLTLARRELHAYEGRAAFSYLTGLTLDEVRQRLAVLPDKTIVIFLSFNSDSAGKVYTGPEALSLLGVSSRAPIYIQSQINLGYGSVGGRLLSYEALGLSAGQMGLRILAGESAQSIAPQIVPSVTMFDWRQLRRWGLDETQIPAGSVVRYKEFSVWELYKWRIVGVTLLCISEALLIVWLLIHRSRRRRAEEETARFACRVKAEGERLEEIVSNVPGVVWESRIQPGTNTRKTVFISPLVENMLGYSVEEWLQTPGFAQSIILEEDREKATSEIEAILESGKEGVLRFRWVAKDGRVLWVETHMAVMRDETGGIVGLRGVTLDISERMQAEEVKNNLVAIVESSDDAILSKTLDGTITTWNAGAERMYGYPASEIVGQHVTTLVPADLKKEVAGILEQIERGESVDHLETVRVTRDGRRLDVSLTISPIRDEHMVIVGASTIARDITARKKAEAEAREQRAELAHLSRVTMLGELSGSLAHELNQPLGAILRNTEAAELFLQEPAPDLDELRAILADIRKDDERAGAVIDRMRSLVKRRDIEHSPLDLNVLAREVISLVQPDADSHKVRLALEPASSLPPVLGDRVQLQQVLLNLLLNAIQAVNECATDRRRVTVRVKPADTQVEVVVSDTGHGIPTDKLARLFEPFFTTKPNGMGMGLPISRTIMKAHLGSICAENDPAGGARFCFTLPVAGERSASWATASQSSG